MFIVIPPDTCFYVFAGSNYGEWSLWSECSQPCGEGFRTRSRFLGDSLSEHTTEREICEQRPCAGIIYSQITKKFKLGISQWQV